MDRNDLLQRAVDAVRTLYAEHHDGYRDHIAADRDAITAVTDAVTAQRFVITHRQIASLASVPGLLVARLINHDQTRMEALVVERAAAERYVEDVRGAIRLEAIRAHGRGDRKTTIHRTLGISRVTLDDWLDKSQA